jgi:hypothetical protein
VALPKQNRPAIRDGRIQAKKKRTDRSYLRPAAAPSVPEEPAELLEDNDERDAAEVVRAAVEAAEPTTPAEPATAFSAPAAPAPAPPAAGRPVSPGKLPTTVRAIQQQGVRKRREVNIQALQRRDSDYAIHEFRRIAVLAVMVVITLVVLTFVLR